MSELESAARCENLEDDCPICLEPLPPFWDRERRVSLNCCYKSICDNCHDERNVVLKRALAEGTFGRQEEQLASTCPLCRTPMPKDGNTGRTLIERFEKGQLPLHAYCDLAKHYVNGESGVERDVERGNEILRLGAEKGDPECQYSVGQGYDDGIVGLPKSTAEAKRWYLAAAEQGHAIAENNLALMFGNEGNDAECLKYMRASASKDYDVACYNLGIDYYHGQHGVQKSYEEAIRVLTPAAERGNHAMSMGLLGIIMCRSDPLPQENPNFTEGVHWMRRAAEKGDQKAIEILRMLEEGASRMCFMCDRTAPPEKEFLRCSRCRAAWYCSKDCQVRHWKLEEGGHKQFCIKWK